MSDVEQAANDGAQVAPVEKPAEEQQQTTEQAQASTTEQVDTQEQDKPRDEKGRFVPQERVNEITRARREAERRAESLERELMALRQQQTAQYQPQSIDKAPTLAEFGGDADAWAAAVTEYAVRKAQSTTEERFQQHDGKRHQQEIADQFEQRAAKYAVEHPDYPQAIDDLIRSVQFRPEVVEAIGLSEHGPAIIHHLANHLDEADRISRLPPHLAAVQLGRIEAQVAAPKPKPVTTAPNPTPTLGGGSVAKKDPARMSYADYKRFRLGESG